MKGFLNSPNGRSLKRLLALLSFIAALITACLSIIFADFLKDWSIAIIPGLFLCYSLLLMGYTVISKFIKIKKE